LNFKFTLGPLVSLPFFSLSLVRAHCSSAATAARRPLLLQCCHLPQGSHAPSTQVLSPRSGRITAVSTCHLHHCYCCCVYGLKHLSVQREPPKTAPSLSPTTTQALSASFYENLSSEPWPPLLPTSAPHRPAATPHHPPHR
jgi:hypothetical protein